MGKEAAANPRNQLGNFNVRIFIVWVDGVEQTIDAKRWRENDNTLGLAIGDHKLICIPLNNIRYYEVTGQEDAPKLIQPD